MAREPYPGERPKDWVPPEGVTAAPASGVGKKIGIGCLVLVGLFVGLAVLGAIVGPQKDGAETETMADGDVNEADAETEAVAGEVAPEIPEERRVSSQQLAGAYAGNEVAAQQWANGGPVQVTGPIEAIELDFMDDPVVRLAGSEMFQWVSVYFDDDAATAISSLRKGQTLTVQCDKVSEVMGSPQLQDCTIVE